MSLHVVRDATTNFAYDHHSDAGYAGYGFLFSSSCQNPSSPRKPESIEENERPNEDGFVEIKPKSNSFVIEENERPNEDGFVEIKPTSDPFVIVSTDEIDEQIDLFIENRNQLPYRNKCMFIGYLSFEYLSDQRIIDFAREIFPEVSEFSDNQTCHSVQERFLFTRGVRRIFQQRLSDVWKTIPDMDTISNSKREEIQWLERIIGSFLY